MYRETENLGSNMPSQSHIGIMEKLHIKTGLGMNPQEAYKGEKTHYASVSVHNTRFNVTCYIMKAL